jgi:uncharacterized protein DUF5990
MRSCGRLDGKRQLALPHSKGLAEEGRCRVSYSGAVEIPLRITLLNPPSGVRFRLQRGRAELVTPSREDGGSIAFDFDVRVADRDGNAPPRFLGPFTQGTPTARFVYVNSGQAAGQYELPWQRRAKVPLGGLTWALIDEVLANPGAVLEAQIAGTARDGGPVCASVRLARAWQIAKT